MDIIKILETYKADDEYEDADKTAFLYFVHAFGDLAYVRENLCGHITVSAWVVNTAHNKVLMAHHNIYDSWAWLGGHADGDKDLLRVAIKEAKEESGIRQLHTISPKPIYLCNLPVKTHIKKAQIVPSHIHYNLVFAFEANEQEELTFKPDENQDVKWINFSDIAKECKEAHMLHHYAKIINKIKTL